MIYVTGDKHGSIDIQSLSTKKFPDGKYLTRDDYVVILGDFGLLWNNPMKRREKRLLDWLSAKPWTTLVVDGNHENFDMFKSLPQTSMFKSKVGVIAPNIYHLQRGNVYTIDDNKIFTFGGAESVDKKCRIMGVSWWPEELPSFQEMDRGLSSLMKHHWNVDYVFTHTAPESIARHLMGDSYNNDPIGRYFEEIMLKLKFKDWYFAHLHLNVKNIQHPNAEGLFHCYYKDVQQIAFQKEIIKDRVC